MIAQPDASGLREIGKSLYEKYIPTQKLISTIVRKIGDFIKKEQPNQKLTGYDDNSRDLMRQPNGKLGQQRSSKPGSSRQDR